VCLCAMGRLVCGGRLLFRMYIFSTKCFSNTNRIIINICRNLRSYLLVCRTNSLINITGKKQLKILSKCWNAVTDVSGQTYTLSYCPSSIFPGENTYFQGRVILANVWTQRGNVMRARVLKWHMSTCFIKKSINLYC